MTQTWAICASHLSGHPGVMLQEMQETQFDQSPAGILHTKAGREKASLPQDGRAGMTLTWSFLQPRPVPPTGWSSSPGVEKLGSIQGEAHRCACVRARACVCVCVPKRETEGNGGLMKGHYFSP